MPRILAKLLTPPSPARARLADPADLAHLVHGDYLAEIARLAERGRGSATWPHDDTTWKALADGERTVVDGKPFALSVVDCGDLVLPTGNLIACDPFADLYDPFPYGVRLPPGRYPVRVTLAEVSGPGGPHPREAYATLLVTDAPEVARAHIVPEDEVETLPEGEYFNFGVDSGTACLVDYGALAAGMPADPDTWRAQLFDTERPDAWFERMDDPAHLGRGLANVPLPRATDGANIVLVHSGWGDGAYPLVAGFDAHGELCRIHIDFLVVSRPPYPD